MRTVSIIRRQGPLRRGAALVEFAVLLPLLVFLFLIAVDFCRLFHHHLTLVNCCRNGALWLSDPKNTCESPYQNVEEAALADAPNIEPKPTITSAAGTDSEGPYVECTGSYEFTMVTGFFGFNTVDLTRTVRCRVAPVTVPSPCP